jgi:hypothetical protein
LALEEVTALTEMPQDTQDSTQAVAGEATKMVMVLLAQMGLLVEAVAQILSATLAEVVLLSGYQLVALGALVSEVQETSAVLLVYLAEAVGVREALLLGLQLSVVLAVLVLLGAEGALGT